MPCGWCRVILKDHTIQDRNVSSQDMFSIRRTLQTMAAKCSHSTTEAKYFPLICHPSEYILYKINALFTYIRPEGI